MKKTLHLSGARILVALCVMSQSLQTGWCDIDAVPTATDSVGMAAPEDMGSLSKIGTTTSGESTQIASTKPSSVIMGGIVLPKNPLTMDFQDADVRDVLHLLALKSGLNIIYGADVTGPITVHLDRVPFDQAFQTILTLKALVALPMGPKVIRVVTSVTLNSEQTQAATFTRVFRLNYTDANDLKRPLDAIRPSPSPKSLSTII